MTIFLIGFMASGKSSIGRKLANRLQYQFVDLDDFIEEKIGLPISEIFAEKGEEAFRKIEQQSLQQVGQYQNTVISTGGGTPCFYDNIAYMNEHGQSFFLKNKPEILCSRLLEQKDHRPLVSKFEEKSDLLAFIKDKYNSRLPFYEQAQVILDCYGKDKRNIVKEISEGIKKIS